MNRHNPQYEPLESALAELLEAERAGVFRSTSVPSTGRETIRPWVRSARFWVPLAAAAVLAIGVWGLMFARQLGNIREWRSGVVTAPNTAGTMVLAFADCMHGPGLSENSRCATFDFDSDGDVDLADYGRSQLSDAASSH